MPTIDLAAAESEPGDWVPVHFWLTFEDGIQEETTDFFRIRKLVDSHWELRQKRLVNLKVEMADGFEVEVDARLGRIHLGNLWLTFRETGDQWAKDMIWFRRVRSFVRTFEAGGDMGQPIPTHVHAYGFGFSTGQHGRRVFLLRADHSIEWEM